MCHKFDINDSLKQVSFFGLYFLGKATCAHCAILTSSLDPEVVPDHGKAFETEGQIL